MAKGGEGYVKKLEQAREARGRGNRGAPEGGKGEACSAADVD